MACLSAAKNMKLPADLVYMAQLLSSRQRSWVSGRRRTEAENWLPHVTDLLSSFAHTSDRKSIFAARQHLNARIPRSLTASHVSNSMQGHLDSLIQ